MTRRPRILLILRDIERREELGLVLERAGYVVEQAADQKDGLRTMYQIHPDLIILDLSGGTEAGWQTYERIRLITDTPLILIGSPVDAFDPRAGLDAQRIGFVDYPPSAQRVLELAKARLAPALAKWRSGRRRVRLATGPDS